MDPYNTADALNPRPQPAATGAPVIAPANPYAAPGARLAEPRSQELAKGSRVARLAAALLDGLTYIIGFVPAFSSFVTMMRASAVPDFSRLGVTGLLGFAIFFCVLGFNLYLIHRSGQTIGKKLLGLRIVRTDGSPASLGRVFVLRMLVPGMIGRIPFFGGFFSLADAMTIFGSEKRCIHDYFADTIVVDA